MSFLSERDVLIAKNVTTKYTERGHINTENVRHQILALSTIRQGILHFFTKLC